VKKTDDLSLGELVREMSNQFVIVRKFECFQFGRNARHGTVEMARAEQHPVAIFRSDRTTGGFYRGTYREPGVVTCGSH